VSVKVAPRSSASRLIIVVTSAQSISSHLRKIDQFFMS
jgi:hypothetical protein